MEREGSDWALLGGHLASNTALSNILSQEQTLSLSETAWDEHHRPAAEGTVPRQPASGQEAARGRAQTCRATLSSTQSVFAEPAQAAAQSRGDCFTQLEMILVKGGCAHSGTVHLVRKGYAGFFVVDK